MEIVWYNVFVLALWHIGFLYAATLLPSVSYTDLSLYWIFLWVLTGLGITAGAHRLWAHRSYTAHPALQVFLMIMNSMAFQGSILEWARDHRTHHKGSESNSDPHNATRGFFFAHCGWVMVRKHRDVIASGKKLKLDDLHLDKIVAFQAQYYLPLAVACCYGIPALMGYCRGDTSTGFWIGGVFRHVFVLHMTWCVNSVAHLWGDHPYSDIRPSENLFVSIGAMGEGWHNYHHKYPKDYATGEFGISSGQWNPTKLFIDACALLGLAWDRKRSSTAKMTREKRAEKLPPTLWDTVFSRLFFGRSEAQVF